MSKLKQNKLPVNISNFKKVKITKLTDDYFKQIGEKHPNLIDEGFTTIGYEIKPPTIGERYFVGKFSTSLVEKINDDNTIKTTYSTYKLEYLK